MFKYKYLVFTFLILFFLLLSFYPTIFEVSQADKLLDQRREFILEHNYYFPDFNLYLSKIRQGHEGRLTALERYTSEPHQGSLIQVFYVILGRLGSMFNLDPNLSYQLGRVILSPLLLVVIFLLMSFYFRDIKWQILAFIITLVSESFPRFFTNASGTISIGRYMEWWSNIDALQRITFIPHVLFGQVVSFYLLYQIIENRQQITRNKLIIYIILGNLTGLVFPPSLITLNSVLLLILLVKTSTWIRSGLYFKKSGQMLFVIFSSLSLLYVFITTRQLPWSALVDFHKTHPMMIPLDQYVLGTGPIIFLGFFGAILSIIKREKRFQPLIFWVLTTFTFASFFSIIKEQSPLRFTQTGLFIPLGILGTYFFQQALNHLGGGPKGLPRGKKNTLRLRGVIILLISFYLLENFFMMKTSLDWQINFITQRVGASVPQVPYPPQTMYPLKEWMDGIIWLRNNTDHNDVVFAAITAGNFIPAYSGNTVYFGQSNTVDYERKQAELLGFFKGEMSQSQARIFLKQGRIKYVFFSVQEKEFLGKDNLEDIYPFLKTVYGNNLVTIYEI